MRLDPDGEVAIQLSSLPRDGSPNPHPRQARQSSALESQPLRYREGGQPTPPLLHMTPHCLSGIDCMCEAPPVVSSRSAPARDSNGVNLSRHWSPGHSPPGQVTTFTRHSLILSPLFSYEVEMEGCHLDRGGGPPAPPSRPATTSGCHWMQGTTVRNTSTTVIPK